MDQEPLETLRAFQAQTLRIIVAFMFAAAIGSVAALVFKLTSTVYYPSWKVAMLVHGFLFWPWLFTKGSGKGSLTRWDAFRAYREIKRHRG